jgi:hypothetical protein
LFEAAALGAKEVVAAYRTSGLGDYVIKIGADEVAGFDDTLRWLRGAAVQCQAVRQSVNRACALWRFHRVLRRKIVGELHASARRSSAIEFKL